MGELHDAGRTLVLITHDVEVASASDRVIGIRDGLFTENDPRDSSRASDELARDLANRIQRRADAIACALASRCWAS